MKIYFLFTTLLLSLHLSLVHADNNTVNELLKTYATQGVIKADANKGRQMWQKTYKRNDGVTERSCASCHTKDLTAAGEHVKTNKLIKPMSPSVNSERLTSPKKIEKWFKRNCKWTLGRECTTQEKANFLVYIENTTKF